MAPSTAWSEVVSPDEQERFERFGQIVQAVQKRRAHNGKMGRALHVNSRGTFEAEFKVLDGLPVHLRVGLFAAPKSYRSYVRISNGSARHQPDSTYDFRGFAFKVVGVPGKKVIKGMEDASTQDFLLIRTTAQPFRTPHEFIRFLQAANGSRLALIPKLAAGVGIRRGVQILRWLAQMSRVPSQSFACGRFYSAAPIRFGPYAVKYSLRSDLTDAGIVPDDFASDMTHRLRNGDVSYDFSVQFFVDEKSTPIEDALVEWPETVSPYIPVGRLVIPRQDPDSARGRAITERVEPMSFDPWHALVEHQPLGAVMRARNVAYRASTQLRGAAPEPDGSETFPKAG